ncbi:MAG: CoA-binding domain protein, partial [Planctomycetaceae bacterium]|nr:CoA-binding domain protein [Planctomycetaceae bacterium]
YQEFVKRQTSFRRVPASLPLPSIGLTVIDFENLDGIFRPASVAVVGASDKKGSVGHDVYANLKAAQFPGRLIAINQQHSLVQGDPAWPSLDRISEPIDLVVVCTPAVTVPAIARCCGEQQVRGMIVISAGFRETGEAGRKLEAELREVLAKYPLLRMIGPNCLGVLAPHSQLNASFSATMPRPGGLAVISQSGALCTAMLDWSLDREIGFSGFVSVGNMVDVGMGDLIDYFAADAHTTAILLYMESLTDPRHFMASARACTRTKPIIALKSGRFAESSQAASSHTGAMAGVDAVYDAAFRRAGIERVFSFDDLFDSAKLLEGHRETAGPRLAILTNAGGPGIMASDAWLAQRGQMARMSPESIAELNRVLPAQWSHGNPVDVLGDAPAERFAVALEIVARDPGVDSLIVMLTPQSMTDPVAIANAVAAFRMPPSKPLLAVWMGGPSVRSGRHILELAKVPVYVTPEQAVNALAHLVSAGRLRAQSAPLSLLSGSQITEPGELVDMSRQPSLNSERAAKWRARLASSTGLLGEVIAKELLADYGVPVVPTVVARTAAEAVELAATFGFPAALKIISPDISHKTDVGGVELNLANTDAVAAAYERILESVSRKQPDAHIEGVSVQPMVTASRGVELLLGATRDAIFGPVIVVGSGGVTAEIQHDLAMQLPPLSERRVALMLSELRISPILRGYRGRPGVNQQKLTEVVLAFSRLVEDLPELQAVEINPLLVTADEVIALDARVIVEPSRSNSSVSFSHLAVRPYPTSLISVVTLSDNRRIRLRPIRLDDEARWLDWLEQHPMSWSELRRFPQRACSLDYDSEMLIIAEDSNSNWVGVAFIQRQYRTKPSSVSVETTEAARDAGLGKFLEQHAAEILKGWNVSAVGR